MGTSQHAPLPASLTRRAAHTRWITPGIGLVVGLVAAAIVVARAARREVDRLREILDELESTTSGFRSMWLANQRLRQLVEEVGRGS